MKKHLARLLAISLLLLGIKDASADCAQFSATLTSLPALDGGFQVNGLNSAGQLTGFFYSSADLDSIGGIEAVADGLQLRPDGVGGIRRLNAVNDVGAHRDRHVAIDPPQDRLLVAVFDMGDL